MKAPHVPDAPTTCPLSLIEAATPSGSPGKTGNVVVLVFPHSTGWNCSTPQAAFGSLLVVSAHPTASLRLLIQLAMPFGPPSVGSFVITPFWNTNGRHAVDDFATPSALNPQKSSLFADGGLRPTHHLTFVVHRN